MTLVSRLHQSAAGGALWVGTDFQWRRLWFVAGFPVLSETSDPDQALGPSLVDAGLLTPEQWTSLQASTGGGRSDRSVILEASLIDPPALQAHQQKQLGEALGAALGWTSGDWRWTALDGMPPSVLEQVVLFDRSPMAVLLEAIGDRLDDADLRDWVDHPSAGTIGATTALGGALAGLDLPSSVRDLGQHLAHGARLEELEAIYGPSPGPLHRVLWLLELAGLVSRSGGDRRPDIGRLDGPAPGPSGRGGKGGKYSISRPGASVRTHATGAERISGRFRTISSADESSVDDSLDDSVFDSIQTEPGSATPTAPPAGPGGSPGAGRRKASKITPQELSAAVARDFRKRMRKDYYSFLGLKPEAPLPIIDKACNRLSRRWNRASRMAEIPEERREMAREMLSSVRLIWRTLGDQERRAEYDRRMARGQPPIIQPIKAADLSRVNLQAADPSSQASAPADLATLVVEAQRSGEANDWGRAVALLRRGRSVAPDDPDVLAELGWATWFASGRTAAGMDDAEEFLQLARTFDPGHDRALECLARLAVARQDTEVARRRLTDYLERHPTARWARTALDALPAPKKSSPGAKAFWRR